MYMDIIKARFMKKKDSKQRTYSQKVTSQSMRFTVAKLGWLIYVNTQHSSPKAKGNNNKSSTESWRKASNLRGEDMQTPDGFHLRIHPSRGFLHLKRKKQVRSAMKKRNNHKRVTLLS